MYSAKVHSAIADVVEVSRYSSAFVVAVVVLTFANRHSAVHGKRTGYSNSGVDDYVMRTNVKTITNTK